MIPNMTAVGNGKGGVLKTTIAMNLAGIAAGSGWRVLVVDTDYQGDSAADLGYVEHPDNDFGASLMSALRNGTPPTIIRDVRENLDVIACGDEFKEAGFELYKLRYEGQTDRLRTWFEDMIAPIASDYHLVLVDTPPHEQLLLNSILSASHYGIIPVLADKSSRSGIDRIARDLVIVLEDNPHFEVLGVVVAGLDRRATKQQQLTRVRLKAETGDVFNVFDNQIFDSRKAANEAREAGLLAFEYEAAALGINPRLRMQALRDGKADFSGAASNLASDYQALSDEILQALSQRLDSYYSQLDHHASEVAQ